MISKYIAGLTGTLPSAPGAANSVIRFTFDREEFVNIDDFGGSFDYESNLLLVSYTCFYYGFQGARPAAIPITDLNSINKFKLGLPGRVSSGLNYSIDLPMTPDSIESISGQLFKFSATSPTPPRPYSQINLEGFDGFPQVEYYDWHFDTRNLQPLYYGQNVQIRIELNLEGVRG